MGWGFHGNGDCQMDNVGNGSPYNSGRGGCGGDGEGEVDSKGDLLSFVEKIDFPCSSRKRDG